MRWLFLFVVLWITCGCIRQASNSNANHTSPDGPTLAVSAFTLEEAKGRIVLDTRITPGQCQRFDIGLGSITVETITAQDGILTVQYTPEVEGGYSVYECKLPISARPVVFEIDLSGVPGETSFDLSECKRLKTGNLHFGN